MQRERKPRSESGDLTHALTLYNDGISHCIDVELARDIYRNRALVQLKLGRFQSAVDDALTSLSGGTTARARSLDGKAQYRAGLAIYQLGLYGEARDHFQAHLGMEPNDGDSLRELSRCDTRISEEDGHYDFEGIISRLSPTELRVDSASYTLKVHVAESEWGLGLFAKEAIPTGELIFCEKALFITFANDPGAHKTFKYQPHRPQMDIVTTGAAHRVLAKKLFESSRSVRWEALPGCAALRTLCAGGRHAGDRFFPDQ